MFCSQLTTSLRTIFDVFSSFFESVKSFVLNAQLLLMKRGGRVIYGGKLGVHSQIMIDYFQVTINRPVILILNLYSSLLCKLEI